jgi:basic membrane lipoprotein Med (substrate-binding protein (PBP1-ABC) superfamily)
MKAKLILLLFCILLIAACSKQPKPIQFDGIKTINVVCALDNGVKVKTAKDLISEASQLLTKQIGARLEVTGTKRVDFKSTNDAATLLSQLYRSVELDQFDIAIGFAHSNTAVAWVQEFMIGRWAGVSDATYFKYIVLRKHNIHTLMHELGHILLRTAKHSDSGLMRSMGLSIIPGVVEIKSSLQFSKKDRELIAKNVELKY